MKEGFLCFALSNYLIYRGYGVKELVKSGRAIVQYKEVTKPSKMTDKNVGCTIYRSSSSYEMDHCVCGKRLETVSANDGEWYRIESLSPVMKSVDFVRYRIAVHN